jgi:hypothetical protein
MKRRSSSSVKSSWSIWRAMRTTVRHTTLFRECNVKSR